MIVKPLVSVAIITYNQKEFLRDAIESVLAQDYESVEIVVGDDCSNDGTQLMLEEYKKKYGDKFVILLSSQNKGITFNSNAVHFACSGKYIAWLGGDDLMLAGKLKKQVEFLEANPDYNIVYHQLDVFDSTTDKHIKFYNTNKDKFTGGVEQLIKHGTFNGACATMVRRSASPSYGFHNEIPVASDWLYWIEHLINGGKIGYIDEVLGRYRRHDKNVSNPGSLQANQGYKDFLKTCEIVTEKYPAYRKQVLYRLSVFHRGIRKYDYISNLKKSLGYNPLNFISSILLLLHFISFKKLKV